MAVAVKQKPKTTIHHKRRTGSHQKRDEHFTKTYWPYLPIALIVGVGIVVNSLVMHPGVLGYATNMTHGGLLAQTNTQRTQNNLGALALNATLSQAAQAKAEDMVARDYWSHNTPDGQEPWVFITGAGYQYQAAGENLAYGFTDSASAVTGWMNSPGHRANILNSAYSEVGFGMANSPNYQQNGQQTIVVAMYARPVVAAAQSMPSAAQQQQPSAPAAQATPTPTAAPAPDETAAANEQPIAISRDETEDATDVTIGATVAGETPVSRIQVATSGGAPWSLVAASFAGIILLLAFVTRHSIAWHRKLVQGEQFILKHKVLDVVIVSAIMLIFILSRTVGYIQ